MTCGGSINVKDFATILWFDLKAFLII